jgi:hypothetical protein
MCYQTPCIGYLVAKRESFHFHVIFCQNLPHFKMLAISTKSMAGSHFALL